jgi:hypothetical protein
MAHSNSSNLKLVEIDRNGNSLPFEGKHEGSFVLCPKAFLIGKSPDEIEEMRNIYRMAYLRAMESCGKMPEGFLGGGGI